VLGPLVVVRAKDELDRLREPPWRMRQPHLAIAAGAEAPGQRIARQ
jgi:hypothetical protein